MSFVCPNENPIKNKNDNNINDYYNLLCENISKKIPELKKMEKMEKKEEDLNEHVPNFNEFGFLIKYNYNLHQLKTIAKTYKLKITGNKSQLITRIFSFLFLSVSAIKIQKIMRGCLIRKYISYHGPALKNRLLCTNNFDFLSMEQLTTIPKEQFFSYRDEDGFIYGFDLISLHNLIYKCNGAIKNPFNTKPIHSKVIEEFRSLLRLSRLLKINICLEITDVTKEVSYKKSVELRALTLFQNIDALGNYSNSQWFLMLNRLQLIRFIRELIDIWEYRAPLTKEVKCAICPPTGKPFTRLTNHNILYTLENLDDVRKIILDILEKFVMSGIDKDSKCLGAYYVLGAITLVNNDAATSLPWLYQAVCHM
jgi:hypothetical protein